MNANRYGTYTSRRLGRRQILRGGALLASGSAAALLAACSSSNNNKTSTNPTAAKPTSAATANGGGAATPGAASATAQRSGTPAAAATTAPKKGGRLLVAGAWAASDFNVVKTFQEGYTLSGLQVYDRLISYRIDKDYVLEAATSVEQPDPMTVTFKLKPGMKFQDKAPVSGRAVMADDIVKDELFVRDYPKAENNTFQLNSMDSVTAVDANTVTFKLKAPNGYLFSGTQLGNPGAQCIIPKELLDNLDANFPIGSGPYQLSDYTTNQRYLYKRFDGYHEASKGQPYIDEREFTVLLDPVAQEAAFRSQQSHYYALPTPIVDGIKKDLAGKVYVDEFPSLSMWTFSANVNKAPFNDVRVREALYRVLNKQQFVDLLALGKGTVATGPLSPGLTDYKLDQSQVDKYFKRDAKAAKQLLDAAAFPYDKTFDMTTVAGSAVNQQGMEVCQQQLSQVGIKVQLRALPLPDYFQLIATTNWDVWYAAHPAYDTPQVPLRLQHTKTGNAHAFNGLRDPAVDKMIEQAEATVDRNARIKVVKDTQIALLDKYTPFIITHSATGYVGIWNYVKDYESTKGATEAFYRTNMWLDK